jgi:hypothetical protein
VPLAVVPLLLVAATPAASSARYVWDPARGNDAPISAKLGATSTVVGSAVHLRWQPVDTGSTHSYYLIYRSNSGVTCSVPTIGGKECDLLMTTVGITRDTSFVDHPSAGRHWYRIGLAANYTDTLDGSDLMLIGPPTAAKTPG